MARKRARKDPHVGRQDRWPSDYGVRDEQRDDQERSWMPGEKGQGREGRSKGYGGSGGVPKRIRTSDERVKVLLAVIAVLLVAGMFAATFRLEHQPGHAVTSSTNKG